MKKTMLELMETQYVKGENIFIFNDGEEVGLNLIKKISKEEGYRSIHIDAKKFNMFCEEKGMKLHQIKADHIVLEDANHLSITTLTATIEDNKKLGKVLVFTTKKPYFSLGNRLISSFQQFAM